MQNWFLEFGINYPVSYEQVLILNFFGLRGEIWLFVLRLICLLLLVLTLCCWYKVTIKCLDSSIAKISTVLIFLTPLFFVIWYIYPFLIIKLLIFVIGSWLVSKNVRYFWLIALVLFWFNYNILGDRPAILSKFNLKDAQAEVTKRISSEDSLQESIAVPLWWRRLSENKYFFSYKQIVAETISFYDFESIFFQEINPLGQKSIVMFYWPEIFVFVLGLYAISHSKNKYNLNFLWWYFLWCWIDFVFSEGAPFKRLVLVLFPISILLGLGVNKLYVMKNNLLSRLLLVLFVVFIAFGYINSFIDMKVRRDYWFDNRPLAFEFWFKELSKLDLERYNLIQVSSLVGSSREYCYFYLGQLCNNKKFVFNSFDLEESKPISNSIYAGFGGEFVGSRFKNDFSQDWIKNADDKGIRILSVKSLRDTIAYRFGNDLGVGVIK